MSQSLDALISRATALRTPIDVGDGIFMSQGHRQQLPRHDVATATC